MKSEDELWEILKEYGITTEDEVKEALKKYKINIGVFTSSLA